MKKIFVAALTLLLFNFISISNNDNVELLKVNSENTAFKAGEELIYKVHYNFINAGVAKLTVENTDKTIFGKKLLKVVGVGKSVGKFDKYFKVRDIYTSFIDAELTIPYYFLRRVDEGGYLINQTYKFNQTKKYVEIEEDKKVNIEYGVQDMISSFYKLRKLDFEDATEGKMYEINMFIDGETHKFKLKYLGKLILKTKQGKIKCLKIQPLVMKGRIWNDENDLTIYVSDDINKVPIVVETKLLVGTLKATLIESKGLVKELTYTK